MSVKHKYKVKHIGKAPLVDKNPTIQFNFICFKCNEYFSKPFKRKKLKKKLKCLLCGSKDTKMIGEKPPLMHEITNKSMNANKGNWIKRRRTHGMEKETALNFYKESCEASKERMDTGLEHYKRVEMDVDYMIKNNIAKVGTDKDRIKAIDALKKENQHIYGKMKKNMLPMKKYNKNK